MRASRRVICSVLGGLCLAVALSLIARVGVAGVSMPPLDVPTPMMTRGTENLQFVEAVRRDPFIQLIQASLHMLWFMPVALLGGGLLLGWNRPSWQRRGVWISISLLAGLLGAWALGLGFDHRGLNVMSWGGGYAALCGLLACWRSRQSRVIQIIGTGVLMLAVLAGYTASTVGLLALIFVLGDLVRAPRHSQTFESGLVCRTTVWGASFSDSGDLFTLVRPLPGLPGVHRVVFTAMTNAYDEAPAISSCVAAERAYQASLTQP